MMPVLGLPGPAEVEAMMLAIAKRFCRNQEHDVLAGPMNPDFPTPIIGVAIVIDLAGTAAPLCAALTLAEQGFVVNKLFGKVH